jgi:hypothetical protein
LVYRRESLKHLQVIGSRAVWSYLQRSFDAEERGELLMEEESDEELEELNEFFEPRKNISSSGNEAAKPHVT